MDDPTAAEGSDEGAPEPPRVVPIAGDLVSERFTYNGGRWVTVYLPPATPTAVVYAATAN